MKIRPKNDILFAETGVKFSQNNLRGANWRQQVFNNYRLHLLDLLTKYGEARDYGEWLNEMQSRHAKLYKSAGNNWENVAYKNDLVGLYQLDYKGGLGNNGTYKRFGTVQINPEDKYDFNLGITPNYNSRYNIASPPTRTSGDRTKQNYKVDNLYSAITDDRRLLGRKGDWDETSEDYKLWQKELNSRGWETYLDAKENGGDDYYKLRRIGVPEPQQLLNNPPSNTPTANNPTINNPSFKLNPNEKVDKESIWNKLNNGIKNIAPDLLDSIRLAGNMVNNLRVYNESMKAIIPTLQLSYHTYRQVVGDEATKQGFYRRAAEGQTRAARPFTSDADRLVAYMNEAKRIGDELKALGDLADNLRIRETSAESSAHLDANRERDTQVANNNIAELIKARAAKHQLTALKYSADLTNIDLFLMGKLAKLLLNLAELKNNNRQLALLDMQEDMLGNTALADLRTKREKAYNDYINNKDESKSDLLKKIFDLANINYQRALILALRDALHKYNLYAKSGTKLTYKNNTDKFLYKTSKDIVEHFRRMSKMTDDSRIRTMFKTIKLSSHPKKMQLGGVAPFTIYRPIGVGGETAISTQTSSSGTGSSSDKKSDREKDKLDMIKELFKSVQGLPIDASKIYSLISGLLNKYKAFGEEMSIDDIASMYLNAMNQINHLKYSLDAYNKAHAVAVANDSLDEIAVGTNGEMALLDSLGNVTIGSYAKWKESEGKLNPLTNGQLLTMRAHSPNLAFNDSVFDIVNNGVGMTKIFALIKSMADSLGSSTEKLEGISEVESKQVKAGLQILAGTNGTPDGHYLVTTSTKELSLLVKAALNYIYSMLPKNYKTILALHSGGEEQSKTLINYLLSSQISSSIELTITPLTGKASDKESGNGDGDMLPSVAFFNGLGEKDTFIILDKTSDGLKINVVSTSITSKGYNTGSITFDKLESSDFGGQLLMNQATMGDSLISSTGRNNIIIDGRIYLAELPIDQETKKSGIIKPDLRFLKNIETADAKLREMGIDKSDPKNINTVNKVYRENNLPILYTISNNKPTITSEYARFAIVNGIGTEEAFGDNPEFNDGILEISSDKERQLFETMMQLLGNTKYKLDNGYGIGPLSWGETKLYKGTIYIPMVTSNISALAGTGFKAKGEEYNLIEARQQVTDAARNKDFVPAGDVSNFK